jgi:hypothetical protein
MYSRYFGAVSAGFSAPVHSHLGSPSLVTGISPSFGNSLPVHPSSLSIRTFLSAIGDKDGRENSIRRCHCSREVHGLRGNERMRYTNALVRPIIIYSTFLETDVN